MTTRRGVSLLLRIGVAFAFLFPAVNAFFDPYAWVGYLPTFIRGVLPDLVLLHGFGILEIATALWILSGRKIVLPSALATVILLVIVVLNFGDIQILFRDVSIALASGALTLLSRTEEIKNAS